MAETSPNETTTVGLGANPLFRQLSAEAAQKMSSMMTKASYKAGDTIFLEREPGDALYLIESGKVRIWVHDGDKNQITLTNLEPGGFFGEMSV